MTRSDLIAKLEAASEGSRELDGQVMLAMGEGFIWPENTHVTTSIDAIVRLIEKMLIDPYWEVHTNRVALGHYVANVGTRSRTWVGYSYVPYLALCIALLRTLDAKETAEKAAMDDMLEQDGDLL